MLYHCGMTSPREPANEIESALQRAASDPSARPDFYRAVLSSALFFLTPSAASGDAEAETVTLVFWNGSEGSFLPIFSSRGRVDEAIAADGGAYGIASLPAREVFRELAGTASPAVLNPGLPFAKYFSVEEIRAMVDGSIYQGESITIERTAKVSLSEPDVYPQALVDAMSRLFSQHPGIEAAYLAIIHDPSGAEPPHPIIGVVGEGFDDVVERAGMMAAEILRGPVDLVPIAGNEEDGLGAQLRQGRAPFFDRSRPGH